MPKEKDVRTGGIESKLDSVAGFYIFVSVIALVACIVLSQSDAYARSGLSVFLIIIGILALLQGIIAWILFRAGGEVIRLLKKLNGLPYAGFISETEGSEEGFECSECHSPVSADAKVCPKCGAELDEQTGDAGNS